MNAQERKWEIENAASTLEKAEEIKADKKLFNAARKQLQKKQKILAEAITKLGGVK